MKKISYCLLALLAMTGCAQMFNEMVLPNQCKKCDVVDTRTGDVLWSEQGCGGDNTRIEEEAKIYAYDQSRFGNLCELEVRCETWRKEKEDEE